MFPTLVPRWKHAILWPCCPSFQVLLSCCIGQCLESFQSWNSGKQNPVFEKLHGRNTQNSYPGLTVASAEIRWRIQLPADQELPAEIGKKVEKSFRNHLSMTLGWAPYLLCPSWTLVKSWENKIWCLMWVKKVEEMNHRHLPHSSDCNKDGNF